MKKTTLKNQTEKADGESVFRSRRNAFIARVSIIILLVACALILNANSQESAAPQNFHQWGAVTLFNGLPSDNVRAVAQTGDGILWFGTPNGLARFDGRRVENFSLPNLPSSDILALQTAADGTLWIGTKAGAGRLINNEFVPVGDTLGKPVSAIINGATTILISPDAVFKIRRNSDDSLDVNRLSAIDLHLTDAAYNANGQLLFSSRGRGMLVEENDAILEINSRPRSYFVNVLHRDAAGDLWFGARADDASSGFFSAADLTRPERLGENTGTVTAFAETPTGDLWIGTEKNGLFHFQNRRQLEHFTFENTAGGLRSNQIYTLFIDRESVIWIGTNRGACRFDAASPFNQTLSDSGNSNFVRTIFKSADGTIYAGTNRGLFAASDGDWLAAENFAAKTVYDIGENSAGQITVSTPNGLFGLDNSQLATGDTRSTVVFRGATYAAIFGRGVLNVANGTLISDDAMPTALFADAENLWIGTAHNGVFRFDGTHIRTDASLANLRGAAIRKILRQGAATVWFSGENGLFRWENNDLQTIIADQDVRDLAINGADVWAATLKGGLLHLKFDAVWGWLSSDLNVEQGLPSEQIFSILPIDDHLLIGTNRGIVNYAPSAVAPQIVAARVLSQRLYNREEIARPIALEYPQNSLLLEVAGLSSRTFPEQFQYGFLLKNQSGEILERRLSNDAQFSPADLPPGAYSIEARAFNKDLLASNVLTVAFYVAKAPFPWTATALGVLLAVALVGLAWAMIERRRIAQRNRELAAARFDLANEAERERRRIARDLHDQTLADLRSLMLKSDDLPAQTNDFRREIEAVSMEIRRICEDLSPSVLENVGLTAALEFLLGHTIEKHEFHAVENLEDRINFPANAQMQIYRVAQEVLTNIKHHSDARFVRMNIEISAENEFVLSIADDGTFFDPAAIVSKGRGIANIKSRAALINARIFWRENSPHGTIFQLHIAA